MDSLQRLLHIAHMRRRHMSQSGLLLCSYVLLITIFRNVGGAAAATGISLDQAHRHADIESRQLGGFNADAAFNGNSANSNFGFYLGGDNGGNSPTTSPLFNTPSYATTRHPTGLNNFNSLTSKPYTKETNKHAQNDYKQNKNLGTGYVDRYSHRYPDGSYEYRYELADGTARYERGYFLLYDNKKSLVVVGYYSYRMPNGRYLTVFYNADRNGYRQNQSITPQSNSHLPRSIEVPQNDFKDAENNYFPKSTTTTTSPRPSTTTRRGRFF